MRRAWPILLSLFLVLGVLLCAPGLASAADEKKPGLLDPRFDLTIWSVVVFAALLLVLGKFAWKPMLEGLQQREKTIQGALDEANRAKEEAQTIRTQLQGEMSNAHVKVKELLDEARRDAHATTDQMLAKARDEIQKERDRLRREIDTARDQALHELWSQSAQLATLVSAKAIRRELSTDDHRRLVDEAIAELRTAGASGRAVV